MGGEYGNAILSRYPIIDNFVYCLPEKKMEKRCLHGVKINNGINSNIWIFNTHLDWDNTFEIQNKQIDSIINLFESQFDENLIILGGDFNIDINDIKNSSFKNLIYSTKDYYPTWSSKRPKKQIDNILIKNNKNLISTEFNTINCKFSDHLPFICNVNILV